jgi:hypothetical protein
MQMLLELVLDIDPLNNVPANRYVFKMQMRKQNSIFK